MVHRDSPQGGGFLKHLADGTGIGRSACRGSRKRGHVDAEVKRQLNGGGAERRRKRAGLCTRFQHPLGARHLDEAARLEGSRLEVWWDAGVRDHDDVIGILTSGAHKAVVSTTSLQSARELGQAVELSDSVVFEVVMRDGVVTGGSPDFRGQPLHAALRKGAQQRVEEVLVLDASRPLGAPVDFQGLESLPAPFESLYLGGGIDVATAKALRAPPSVPYKGAVVDLISVLAPFL